ncbi:hypothetical protein [Azotobacter beijerinckii]|uniref:hypothetical protein n=1 Tax=Azotobacter beijerinckii TaxID=170623 RepID=UPI0029541E96|nr:hypothetical protein [Azotobacter beijerinckii]MDV7211262.1 hypothetical protein [Azotobacter beijerinckii]
MLGQRHLLWLKIGDGALVIKRTQAAAAGSGERPMVYQNGRELSGQLGLWFQALREDRLKRRSLTQRLYAEDFTDKTSGDDCSIALTARPLRA